MDLTEHFAQQWKIGVASHLQDSPCVLILDALAACLLALIDEQDVQKHLLAPATQCLSTLALGSLDRHHDPCSLPLYSGVPKLVFVVALSSLDTRAVLDGIRAAVKSSYANECVVLCTVAPERHESMSAALGTALGTPSGPSTTTAATSTTSSNATSGYPALEDQLRVWLRTNANPLEPSQRAVSASVIHLPISFAPLDSHAFVLPALAGTVPFVPGRHSPATWPVLSAAPADLAGSQDRASAPRRIADALLNFLETLDVSEECFTLGELSSAVALEMKHIKTGIAKVHERLHEGHGKPPIGIARFLHYKHQLRHDSAAGASSVVSLVLVDRIVDLVTPMHHADSSLDRVFTLCPPSSRLEGGVDTSMPVSVPDSPSASEASPADGSEGLSAHLVHLPLTPSDDVSSMALSRVRSLLHSKLKEAHLGLRKWLVEVISAESLPCSVNLAKLSGKITSGQLMDLMSSFSPAAGEGTTTAVLSKYSAALETVLIVAESLRSAELNLQWDSVSSLEKVLFLTAVDASPTQTFIDTLLDVVPVRNESTGAFAATSAASAKLAPADVLALCSLCWSLHGGDASHSHLFSSTHHGPGSSFDAKKRLLQTRLEDWLQGIDLPALQRVFPSIRSDESQREAVKRCLAHFWEAMDFVASCRSSFSMFRELKQAASMTTNTQSQFLFRPVVKQLVDGILDPSRPQLPDIKHSASGFRALLKSEFGKLLLGTESHRPDDHDTIIIVVLGGVTFSEIKMVHDALAARASAAPSKKKTILIGGTEIATRDTVLQRLVF